MHPEQYSIVFPALILTEQSVPKAGFALNNNRIVHVVLVHPHLTVARSMWASSLLSLLLITSTECTTEGLGTWTHLTVALQMMGISLLFPWLFDFIIISLSFWCHYYFPCLLRFTLLLAPTEHPGGDSFKPTTMVTQPFPNPHFITPFPYHHSLSPGSLAFWGFPQPSLHCPFLPFPTFSLPSLHYPLPFITTHYLLSSPEQPVRTFNTLVWS